MSGAEPQPFEPENHPENQPQEPGNRSTSSSADLSARDWNDLCDDARVNLEAYQAMMDAARSGAAAVEAGEGDWCALTPGEGDFCPLPDFGDEPQAASPARRAPKRMRPKRSRRQLDRVRRRQMNYLEKRREQKKRMVFYGRIRLFFKLCFAMLLAALLWELLHSSFWTYQSPDYTLANARLLQHDQIDGLVRDWVGKPIYAADTGKLAREILRDHPVVDRVFVRREMFPTRLRVEVFEKQPWAEIYTAALLPSKNAAAADNSKPSAQAASGNSMAAGKSSRAKSRPVLPYALLTANGFVSLKGYQYKPGLFSDLHPEKIIITPKTVLKDADLARLREILWQARQIHGLHLTDADFRNPKLVVLHFAETSVILGRLDTNASRRLSRLIALTPKILEMRSSIESVDLRWEEQVTFHIKPDAKLDLSMAEDLRMDG